jgi:sugar lactone lactonase YvrE
VVCDAAKGALLAVSPAGEVTALAPAFAGQPFGFIDDVDVGTDGTAYFSDASTRFGMGHPVEDVLEHGATGRIFAWRPATGAVELLLDGLHFANGVALARDESWLAVNETGSYRVMRLWLRGPRAGTSEPFVSNLPGFPDNVTFSATRGAFWVALFAPRARILDALAPHPFWRKVVWRLPALVRPGPKRYGFAVAIGEDGAVVATLQDPAPDSYAPITSVREHAGTLWLGSGFYDGLGRIAAP